MNVIVNKYEQAIEPYSRSNYIYKIGAIPGGIVIKTFYVPHDSYDFDKENSKVISEIKTYLKQNGLTAVNKFD